MPSTQSSPTAATRTNRPWPVKAVAALAVVGALGAAAMVAFHVMIELPIVAGGFVVGSLLFAAVAYGTWLRRSWAWPAALVVNGLGLISSVMPWRGLDMSGPPALVTLVALAVLLSAPAREAMLGRAEG